MIILLTQCVVFFFKTGKRRERVHVYFICSQEGNQIFLKMISSKNVKTDSSPLLFCLLKQKLCISHQSQQHLQLLYGQPTLF